MKPDELSERLEAIADSLESCEWNHPLCSVAIVREAAAAIRAMELRGESPAPQYACGVHATDRALGDSCQYCREIREKAAGGGK